MQRQNERKATCVCVCNVICIKANCGCVGVNYMCVCPYVQEINSLGKSSESLITFEQLFDNSYQSHVANGFELCRLDCVCVCESVCTCVCLPL